MAESNKETIIAQISDIHVGESHFVPSLETTHSIYLFDSLWHISLLQ